MYSYSAATQICNFTDSGRFKAIIINATDNTVLLNIEPRSGLSVSFIAFTASDQSL